MKSIFPAAIDGDLLKLVHLSNGFRTVDGAKPLAVSDICKAAAGEPARIRQILAEKKLI